MWLALVVSCVCSSLNNLLGALFEDYSWFDNAHFHVTLSDSKQQSGSNSNGNMCIKGISLGAAFSQTLGTVLRITFC